MPISTKNNKTALKIATKRKLELFQNITSVSQISDTLTPSDIIQASSFSFAGRIFSEPFNFKNLGFSFSDESYIHNCRLFLGLPPALTIGAAAPNSNYDYPVQKCLTDHGVAVDPFLDATADHASSAACTHAKTLE
jgi:hypothetical protein